MLRIPLKAVRRSPRLRSAACGDLGMSSMSKWSMEMLRASVEPGGVAGGTGDCGVLVGGAGDVYYRV